MPMPTKDLTLDNVRVLTHSAIRIESQDDAVLYFDPFQLAEAPHDADIIFITHDHYDHFSPEDAVKVLKDTTVVVAPESCAANVREKLGVTTLGMKPGDTTFVGKAAPGGSEGARICVEAVRAYNVEPERLGFHPKDNDWLGYVVTVDGARYYVSGDTDQNEDNLQVTCDIALIPIGGTYTFDAAQAAAFVNATRPQVVVPTHYGTAVGTKDAVDDFIPLVERDVQTIVKMEWHDLG